MNNLIQLRKLLSIPLAAVLAVNVFTPAIPYALAAPNESPASDISSVPDDPGADRLSGKYIAPEFYEDATEDNNYTNDDIIAPSLNRYGSVQTANTFTGKNYIHQNKFDGCTITNGIDVSSYQTNIDWTQVAASGIEFAFIRVGGRGYGAAGQFYNDVDYDKNMAGAQAAGIKKGIYIFSQATTTDEAVAEAQFILNRIGEYTIELPLVLDYEFASPADSRLRAANLTKDAATAVCLAFCQTIQAAGYTPMIYANPDMLNNHLNADVISGSYPVWLANYTTDTGYSGLFNYWQYASNGTVPGINGNVDMDYCYVPPAGSLMSAIINPIPDQIYTGAAITPALTVTMNGVTLTNGTDYTAVYENNAAVGKASVTIAGINGYIGGRTIPFNIKPSEETPLPEISDLHVSAIGTTYITLGWSAATDVDGYELYRAISLNGEYTLVKALESADSTALKNISLAEGQCYYYKIRTYRSINGEKQFGEFSPALAMATTTSYTRLALPKTDTVIYSDMDVSSAAIADVEKYEFIRAFYSIYDDAGNLWYLVKYNGNYGYMHSGQVTIAKQGKVKTGKVNVRKKSKVTSKRLTTVGKKKKVAIIKTKKTKAGTWYNVIFTKGSKTYKGWIYSIYVKV